MSSALAKCPDCGRVTSVDLAPICAVEVDMLDDKPAPYQSEDFICSHCSKPMHIVITIELFED